MNFKKVEIKVADLRDGDIAFITQFSQLTEEFAFEHLLSGRGFIVAGDVYGHRVHREALLNKLFELNLLERLDASRASEYVIRTAVHIAFMKSGEFPHFCKPDKNYLISKL